MEDRTSAEHPESYFVAEDDIEYEAIQACREVLEAWHIWNADGSGDKMGEAIKHVHAVVEAHNEATSHPND